MNKEEFAQLINITDDTKRITLKGSRLDKIDQILDNMFKPEYFVEIPESVFERISEIRAKTVLAEQINKTVKRFEE